MSHCWVIKRSITQSLYTIRDSTEHTSCLIAFNSRNRALQFRRFINDSENDNQQRQKLIVEKISKPKLLRRCAVTALNVHMFEENQTYMAFSEPTDDIRFHMENNFKYYG